METIQLEKIQLENKIRSLETSVHKLLKFSEHAASFAICNNIENPSTYDELLIFARSLETESLQKLPIRNKMWICVNYKNLDLFKALFYGSIDFYTVESYTILEMFVFKIANEFELDTRLFLLKRFREIWQYCYNYPTIPRIAAVSNISRLLKGYIVITNGEQQEALESLHDFVNQTIE